MDIQQHLMDCQWQIDEEARLAARDALAEWRASSHLRDAHAEPDAPFDDEGDES